MLVATVSIGRLGRVIAVAIVDVSVEVVAGIDDAAAVAELEEDVELIPFKCGRVVGVDPPRSLSLSLSRSLSLSLSLPSNRSLSQSRSRSRSLSLSLSRSRSLSLSLSKGTPTTGLIGKLGWIGFGGRACVCVGGVEME